MAAYAIWAQGEIERLTAELANLEAALEQAHAATEDALQQVADVRRDLAAEQAAHTNTRNVAAALVAELRAEVARLTPKPTPPPDRKVFAHYFTPYPISLDNRAPDLDYYALGYLDPDGEGGRHLAYDGLLRDRPIPSAPLPADYRLTNMRTEIRNAKAAGIDGFFVNIMGLSAGSQNWPRMLTLYKAAEAEGDFELIPMIDGALTGTPAAVAAEIAPLLASPVAGKRAGCPILSSFRVEAKTIAWWTEVLSALGDLVGPPVAFQAVFLNGSDANFAAFKDLAYEYGIWGDPNVDNMVKATHAARAKALGKRWLAPVRPQDARPRAGKYTEARNTELFRKGWAKAIAEADDVQITTWNDYSESSQIAPSVGNSGAWLPLTAYYAAWFRTGTPPPITRDRVIITHRRHPWAAPAASGINRMQPNLSGVMVPRDTVEVLCLLTAPAELTIDGVGKGTAPMGLSVTTVDLTTGTHGATLTRGGRTVAAVTSPHVVTGEPERQDMAYLAALG